MPKVLIHKGQVFFNTYDPQVMREWEGKGARIVPHYTLDEVQARASQKVQTNMGWEIHPVCEGTHEELLAAARETTGGEK
jgi:hypothetical protein